ncbi:hypothetical protein [Lentibacillus salicampi]|uniref:hypothetical protein n=1 Tax=Lentibacillus salicampi TaxID=175306 RepID=UPI001FD7A0B1|nr:hypothetical protein [Lentibacillus salicampi]
METLKKSWLDFFQSERQEDNWWKRKKDLYREREADIVRVNGEGHVFEELRYSGQSISRYLMHLSFLVKQQDQFFREEQVVPFQLRRENGEVMEHRREERPLPDEENPVIESESLRDSAGERFSYDRRAAVQYAERW